jgi:tRNA pseudouridine38-40 synthase
VERPAPAPSGTEELIRAADRQGLRLKRLPCYHGIFMPISRNIRLTLAYDGTNYCGWQVQKNGPSIQAALELAIERLTGERTPVFSAGRTDSGVHALGQVANFHTTFPIPAENFRPALQTKLPEDIVILEAREVSAAFHATFKAVKKRYRYLIDNSPVPMPFLKKYAWQLRRRLDESAMHAAAQLLLGTHDFRSFETDWPNKVTSVRTVMELSVRRAPLWDLWTTEREPPRAHPGLALEGTGGPPHTAPADGNSRESDALFPVRADAPLLIVEIVADGFLYNMVRSIVGTLVNVGRGKWDAADVTAILEAQRRSVAGSTAPACGLYLVAATYE